MNIDKLLRKKPIAAYQEDIKTSQLKRTLGKWELTAIGVGAVIGGPYMKNTFCSSILYCK